MPPSPMWRAPPPPPPRAPTTTPPPPPTPRPPHPRARVSVSCASPGPTKACARLRGYGAPPLRELATQMPGDPGITVFNEDYALSAGTPPQMVTLLHGGQSASLVTSRLGKLGWK